ncbi:MAG: NAD-dependent dehydratase [Acidobacteriales bacterium]|nr:NAD-dependent dehydratase [Terriglobales bacterium]
MKSTVPRTALVTGGTGFIGSHLVRQLLTNGWNVHVVTRPESNQAVLSDIVSKLQIHVYDGTTQTLQAAFKTTEPDVVFHLGSLFLADHQPADVEHLIQSNVLFGTQVLEAMTGSNCPPIVNVGTSWQNYQNSEYDPVCLYAATKQAFESVLTFYTQAKGVRATTLKLFDTYGPDDPRPKLFSALRTASRNRTPLELSPGEQLLNLVYIDDVVQAFLLAAERLKNRNHSEMASNTYAVSANSTISLRDLVSLYVRVTNTEIDARWGARPYRNREVLVPWNKGMVVPNWIPRVEIEEGIRRTEGIQL